MALQGNIDSFSVVDVLRLLGSSSKSGRLAVDGDRGSGALWLDRGLVVSATTARPGGQAVAVHAGDALFDLLRFREGSFVFDADVEMTEPARSGLGAGIDVESLLADSEAALEEWSAIVAVVPSPACGLTLAVDLPVEQVVLDRRLWSALAAVALLAKPTSVDSLGVALGAGELAAMRLARELADLGVVEVGVEVAAEAADTAYQPAGRESAPAPYDGPSFHQHAVLDGAFAEPAPHAEPISFADAVAFAEPAPQGDPVNVAGPIDDTDPASWIAPPPATETWFDPVGPMGAVPPPGWSEATATPPPIGHVAAPASFDAFEPFDPFGTADPAGEERSEGVPATASPVDPLAGAAPEPPPEAAEASAEETAARQAEWERQLAMLSPRAAEAVATAEAGPVSEDEERARVARFLGSV